MGLDALDKNDEENAERLLKESAKTGSTLIARRSAEKYATLGSVQERIKKYLELYETYPDDDTLLLVCRELDNDEEYARVIQLTQMVDVLTANNELAYYRIHALLEKEDTHFTREFERWCLERPFEYGQFKICSKIKELPPAISFRVAVYRQDYGTAYLQCVSNTHPATVKRCRKSHAVRFR